MTDETRFYGTHRVKGGVIFSMISSRDQCGIQIFDREGKRLLERIPFTQEERLGDVYIKRQEGLDPDEISYSFYEEGKAVPDRCARLVVKTPFGQEREECGIRALLPDGEFDWQGDKAPAVPSHKCVGYCLHVRGFTMHRSSRVKARGTFAGLREKLPYLESLGVTTLELQPCYEFLERESGDKRAAYGEPARPYMGMDQEPDQTVLNYWGYKRGYYYAPKASYAQGNPVTEFKELIRDCHQRGMEILMQFYFPCEEDFWQIGDILHFWRSEYHVDGFRLLGEGLPVQQLGNDPYLAECKLWLHEPVPGRGEAVRARLGAYRESFMYDMRRFLKGDEGSLSPALYHMRANPSLPAKINYMAGYHSMTLWDTVTYDRKHNEENGEENRDGSDYNCSWNCGTEGETRRKQIVSLRVRQVKNAFCFLLLSQGIPVLFMGDEFGNTQKGNNNPYCQDNEITWLDWEMAEKRESILCFVRELTALRRNHPILHGAVGLRMMDTLACGYPDLSYHGELAWRPSLESHDHHVGIMYCGRYARRASGEPDDFFYIACNTHWEMHEFAIPKLPAGLEWELILTTREESTPEFMDPGQLRQRVPARTTNIYRSRPEKKRKK